jgi:glyoxylase-like metal-dependent hydrolase (beta-lactamase superfamily II)
MANYRATVGNVEMVVLNDGFSPKRDPLAVYPASKMEQWREYPELLDANGQIQSRYGTTAIRSSGKLIIVDTGLQTAPGGQLIEDMRRKGIAPDDVDIVVMTHLHGDHVGWNLTNGVPTFPKARYLVPKADWEYWTQPSVLVNALAVQHQVLPLEKLNIMDLIDGEHKVTPEVSTLPTPGHTPGHVSILISSAGQRGLVMGDASHTPAQAHYTDWNPTFDVDQEQSRSTRRQLLDRLEKEGALVSAGHYPDPGLGRFVRRRGRRVWQGV